MLADASFCSFDIGVNSGTAILSSSASSAVS